MSTVTNPGRERDQRRAHLRDTAEPWLRLFLVPTLRRISLGWPTVAQIGMIRHELVEQERWISSAQFKPGAGRLSDPAGPRGARVVRVFRDAVARPLGRCAGRLGLHAPGVRADVRAIVGVRALRVEGRRRAGHLRGGPGGGGGADRARRVSSAATSSPIAGSGRSAILATGAQLAGVHFALILAVGGIIY